MMDEICKNLKKDKPCGLGSITHRCERCGAGYCRTCAIVEGMNCDCVELPMLKRIKEAKKNG